LAFVDHFSRRRKTRIIELEIHQDGRPPPALLTASTGKRTIGRGFVSLVYSLCSCGQDDELDNRLDSSTVKPAFTAAAAWREVVATEVEPERELGEGVWSLMVVAFGLVGTILVEVEREGGPEREEIGRVLISGAMIVE